MTYLKHDQLIAAVMLAATMTSLRQADAASAAGNLRRGGICRLYCGR
ncbi:MULTISPECIES: hypothetical protein [Rhizobium]|jgi:hypothetical protein|nr:hypothetical protein [Rhizobium leguminosarum]MBY2938181.1 hypothetical protein [Rhizobium leguminosarum]